MGRRLWLLAGLWLLTSCARNREPAVFRGSQTGTAGSSISGSPLTQKELPTTDGFIALGNLNAQIEVTRELTRAAPERWSERHTLVSLLLIRAQYLGRIKDYDEALESADRLVRRAPHDGESYLTRAAARSALHRFDAAWKDLDKAEELGVNDTRVRSQRAAILEARERLDEALAIRREVVEQRKHLETLGALAALLGRTERIDEADGLFVEAQHHYRDVSPFPVAWLYFQHGLMWQRVGDPIRARKLFREAHDRLPAFAEAASHLASLEAADGNLQRAIELLEPVVRTSGNPEYVGQWAVLIRDSGRSEEAAVMLARARNEMDELAGREPQAYASHAARFWLGAGGEPARAILWADRNFRNLPTSAAFGMLVDTSLAADRRDLLCAAARRVPDLKTAPKPLHEIASRTLSRCPTPPP